MKKLTGKLAGVSAIVFLLAGLLVLTGPASAQTKKKKAKKRPARVSSVPRPVAPQQNLPVIVSRADQYPEQLPEPVTGNGDTPVDEQTTEALPETYDEKIDKISTRIKSLESSKSSKYDAKQRRLLLNLDILTRAEQRAESLRKQLFELIEKENAYKTKLESADLDARPEMIERQVAFAGTLRPEELREARRKNLEAEKRNLSSLLIELQTTRVNLEQNVQKADQLVERLRAVLEKDIDAALSEEPKDN